MPRWCWWVESCTTFSGHRRPPLSGEGGAPERRNVDVPGSHREGLRVVLDGALLGRDHVEHRLGHDRLREEVLQVQVGVHDRVRLEMHGHSGRKLHLRRRHLHAEQVGRGEEAVLGTETDAARRILRPAPEVRRVPIGSEILPEDEMVRARRRAELHLGHVHRLAVRRDLILADLALTADRDREGRHAHLESTMRRPVEMHPLGAGGHGEDQAEDHDHTECAHGVATRRAGGRMSTRDAASVAGHARAGTGLTESRIEYETAPVILRSAARRCRCTGAWDGSRACGRALLAS